MLLKKRYIVFFILVFTGSMIGWAQQAPIFTHHTYTHAFTNPGFAGLNEGICLNGIVRQQWAGFKDMEGNHVAPETYLITADMPIRLLKGGVGLSIIQDALGFEQNTAVQLGYAYHAELGAATLGIGTSVNFLNRSVDFSKFKPHSVGDPVLATGEQSDMLLDMNLGLFLQIEDVYYIGLSVSNMLETKGNELTASESGARFAGDRTFHLHGGYHIILPWNSAYELNPAVNVISNLSVTQINLSATLIYNNQFWGGVNYRLEESVGIMIGLKVFDLRIGYGYDINTLSHGLPGSHEVSLGYCFKLQTEKHIRTYRNTRYL
ncbi:MAG: type IX secretion system membrane protein PorP/SprF [Bacteroidales bacterium]|jgi:type IX secretion system PorP/SprF family membrane protein|nr:type IX secretion system membrane protein PorP/SprF [Bacteroidales bacterium]MDY0370392.1 type IX secretion system membrane protein PorP/SprF [Bacteroidales bacterium]